MDTWTISELAARAADALADLEVSGRVQDVPNERLIRWYTTLGLLDPPLRQGRTVRYTGRHLRQLVAVKRRQADGHTLAEIQAELTGAPNEILTAITGPLPGTDRPEPGTEPSAPRRFWAAEPRVDVQWSPPGVVEHAGHHPPPVVGVTLQGVRLAPGVTLLLETAALSHDDLAALHSAAAPLLDVIAERGLSASPESVSSRREGEPERA